MKPNSRDGSVDHEAALRAAREAMDALRPQWDGALGERRRAVLHARADGLSIYAIAKHLGLTQNAVRQILGLRPPTQAPPAVRPHTTMWDEARAVVAARPCPRCHAPTGEPCTDLRSPGKGRPIPLPHAERREEPVR